MRSEWGRFPVLFLYDVRTLSLISAFQKLFCAPLFLLSANPSGKSPFPAPSMKMGILKKIGILS